MTEINYETRETEFGWLVSGSEIDPDLPLVNSGNGPEVPGHIDDVFGPFLSRGAAIEFYTALRSED